MKMKLWILSALIVAAPHVAFALSIDEAKRSGQVGEKRNGYLGIVVGNPSADVRALVDETNRKRKDAYEAIAKKNGTAVDIVSQLGAKEAYEKSAKGSQVEAADGTWVKKS